MTHEGWYAIKNKGSESLFIYTKNTWYFEETKINKEIQMYNERNSWIPKG